MIKIKLMTNNLMHKINNKNNKKIINKRNSKLIKY